MFEEDGRKRSTIVTTETSTMARPIAVFLLSFTLLLTFIAATNAQEDNAPHIDPNVNKLYVVEGSTRRIACFVYIGDNDVDPESLQWTGPSGKSLKTSTYTENKKRLYRDLVIDGFTEEHYGTYTCKYGSIDTTIDLILVRELKTEGEYFYRNKSATLECNISLPLTSSRVTFSKWTKGNHSLSQLKEPERFEDFQNGTLAISRTNRADSGIYMAHFIITESNNPYDYSCWVRYKAAPLVLDMSKSVNIEEGDSIDLKCVMKGYPIVNVTWLKDNTPLVTQGRPISIVNHYSEERFCPIEMTDCPDDFESSHLKIGSMNSSDEGTYTCMAFDEDGLYDSKSITVRVKDKIEWLWPVIGIFVEAFLLAAIIFACHKLKQRDNMEHREPEAENEELINKGTGIYRKRQH